MGWAEQFPERTWAVENATGLGFLLAQQLVDAGERVLDVQPKLAARVRLLATESTNKNDPHDARSVGVLDVRSVDMGGSGDALIAQDRRSYGCQGSVPGCAGNPVNGHSGGEGSLFSGHASGVVTVAGRLVVRWTPEGSGHSGVSPVTATVHRVMAVKISRAT